jgi:hypothetical protein
MTRREITTCALISIVCTSAAASYAFRRSPGADLILAIPVMCLLLTVGSALLMWSIRESKHSITAWTTCVGIVAAAVSAGADSMKLRQIEQRQIGLIDGVAQRDAAFCLELVEVRNAGGIAATCNETEALAVIRRNYESIAAATVELDPEVVRFVAKQEATQWLCRRGVVIEHDGVACNTLSSGEPTIAAAIEACAIECVSGLTRPIECFAPCFERELLPNGKTAR